MKGSTTVSALPGESRRPNIESMQNDRIERADLPAIASCVCGA
jgi:hypothetical protein